MALDKLFRRLFPKLDDVITNSPYRLIHDSRYRRSFKRRLYERLGYSYNEWIRTAQEKDWLESLNCLETANLDVLEVSPGNREVWPNIGFRSYESVHFPDFDICEMTTGKTYDIVITDFVLEHVKRPHRAVRNIYDMLKPGGIFYISVPCMVRVHGEVDYYRWTMDGLRIMLEDNGFPPDAIEIKSWGNRACIKANFDIWKIHGWRKDMRNEPNLAIVVWATARKGTE